MQLLKNHVISNEAEKILKGSLKTFSPSSPSLKIQIMDGNVCLRCEGKTLLGDVNKLFSKNTSISGQTLGHFDHCIMCREAAVDLVYGHVLPLRLKQTFRPIF